MATGTALLIQSLRTAILLAGLATFLHADFSFATAAEYGALAVVPKQGRVFRGFGTAATAGEARNLALSECKNSRCVVAQEYQPGQCAHVILGRGQIYWNNAVFTRRQLSTIVSGCISNDHDCKLILSHCFLE
ncbi:DUF4189 domain-containing protein [Bosea sp. PAMC 26642]|uniref:DUF4189 domain-containing protein n=1 Tax=Bosea sp. (strain PAMC 26642) TaxID=1792307 RepID=UPI0012E8D8F9